MDKFKLYGRQIAAARALIGMSQPQLAALANISVPTLKRMEASEGQVVGLINNVTAVKTALEAAGATFVADGDVAAGPGVSLKA